MVDNLLRENDLSLKQHKAFKQAEDVPPEAVSSIFKAYTVGKDIGILQTRLNPAMFVSSSR
jgi:hypothetical protein